jgi:hypothetical protein
MLSYCGRKTSERIRQDVEIWSLDTIRVVTTSAPTRGRRMYGTTDFSPQLQMAPQSDYRRLKVGDVCQPHAQAAMAGSWIKRYSNAKK